MSEHLTSQEVLQSSAEFLQHFSVEPDPATQNQEFTEALKQLDPRYKGDRTLVRFELESDQTAWDDESKSVIMDTAEKMRMLKAETPLVGDYELVIALGGARQSNLDRTRYAAQAVLKGHATISQLIVAGSARPLKEAEQSATSNYAPGAVTEFDLVAGAARTVAQEHLGLQTRIQIQYVPNAKASTADIVEAVLHSATKDSALDESAKIAAVTTQIYQASTGLDVARVAQKFGITETFTAGNPSDPEIVAARTPATYLSEILRTLRAASNGINTTK